MSSFAQRLDEALATRNMSPADLSRATGIGEGAISQYRKGICKAAQKNLEKISLALNVPIPWLMGIADMRSVDTLPTDAIPYDPAKGHRIPILGRIAAGLPIYAEQHIEGYTITDLNGGAEYFALRVHGDSMNAIGINDGYLIIVRRQAEVENGEVAVVMVGDEDATVKRFYSAGSSVTLMPQSTNPTHQPQFYDLSKTPVKVLGKVVKVEFSL